MTRHEAQALQIAFRKLIGELAHARKLGQKLTLGVGERPILERELWILINDRALLEDHAFFLRDTLGVWLVDIPPLSDELRKIVVQEGQRGFRFLMDWKLAETSMNPRALAALRRELQAQPRRHREKSHVV